MKKLFLYIFLVLMWCNAGFAETWSCVYEFNNESRQHVVERKGNKFYSVFEDVVDTDGMTIVKENKNFIHLHQHVGYPEDDTTAFIVLLDKIKKSFVMVALQYENSSQIIEGKCRIF